MPFQRVRRDTKWVHYARGTRGPRGRVQTPVGADVRGSSAEISLFPGRFLFALPEPGRGPAPQAAMGLWRWQATKWFGRDSMSGGSCLVQMSMQWMQRGANRHTGSGLMGEASSPLSMIRSWRLWMRGTGMAESNALGVGVQRFFKKSFRRSLFHQPSPGTLPQCCRRSGSRPRGRG